MAAGFPTKANFATGDVLSATNMNDLAGTVNLLSNASAATGSTLVSNAAGTTVAWSAIPAASNPIINSGFDVWQRGTSDFTPLNASFVYTADRWSCFRSAGSSGALVKYVSSTGLAGIPNAGRMQRTSGNTSTDSLYFVYDLESKDSTKYQSKTVTLSFYARAGANFSAASSNLTYFMYSGTGTDLGGFASGWTGAAAIIGSTTATLTTGWVRYTATGTVSSTANQIGMTFFYAGVGTAGAADYFDITGVQIDVGSVALPYRTAGTDYQQELALCQRYYWRINANEAYSPYGQGPAQTTTKQHNVITFPVVMRIKPTSVDWSALNVLTVGVAGFAVTALTLAEGNTRSVVASATVAAGLVAATNYVLSADATTNGYLGYSAEL